MLPKGRITKMDISRKLVVGSSGGSNMWCKTAFLASLSVSKWEGCGGRVNGGSKGSALNGARWREASVVNLRVKSCDQPCQRRE